MRKKLLSIILSLAMVLTMIPAMGSVAYADSSDKPSPAQNLTWDGTTAKWENPNDLSVVGGVNVYLYNTKDETEYAQLSMLDVSDTNYDFSEELILGDTYYFEVEIAGLTGTCSDKARSAICTVPGSYTIPAIANLKLDDKGKMTWTDAKYESRYDAALYEHNSGSWDLVEKTKICWGETSYTWTYEMKSGKSYKASLTGMQGNVPVTELTWSNEVTIESPSGNCGTSATWSLDESTETLTISGTGAMEDFANTSSAPWYEYKDKVKHIVVSEGITRIGKYAFYNCPFASIILPDSLTSIGHFALYSSTASVSSLVIPDNVTSVDFQAFSIVKLDSIHIGANCRLHDDGYDFYLLDKLQNITVSDENPYYTSVNGVLFDKEKKTLIAFPPGRTGSYTVPSGVTAIGTYAFYGSRISGVVLNNGLETIDRDGFGGCAYLTSIYIPDSVTFIDSEAFISNSALKNITIGAGLEYVSDGVFANVHPETVTVSPKNTNFEIKNHALLGKVKLASTYYTGMLIYIPKAGETSYTIPEGVTFLDRSLFENNSNLTSISMPEGLKLLSVRVFNTCAVETLYIPEGIESFGNYSFERTTIKNVYYEGTDWSKSGGSSPLFTVSSDMTVESAHEHIIEDIGSRKGCYCGYMEPAIEIDPKTLDIFFNDNNTFAYTGKAQKPNLWINNGPDALVQNVDYKVTYPSSIKNVGTYTVKIEFIGKYTGSTTKSFKVVPAVSSIKSLTPGKKKMTVKMPVKPSSKGASTYQIYYKQKGTSKWKSTTTTAASKTIKSLKKKKQYYVKVRAYKKVGTTTYYGAWSATKLSKKIK